MNRRKWLLIVDLILGACVSYLVLLPREVVNISKFVMCISGTPGDRFVAGVDSLTTVGAVLFPMFLEQAIVGTESYRDYCFASVYVFSRIEDRSSWYRKKLFSRLVYSLVYTLVFAIGAGLLFKLYGRITADDNNWIPAAVYYLVIYSLWLFITSVCVDMLSIRFGSTIGFIVVAAAQMLCMVAMFATTGLIDVEGKELLLSIIARLNPASCLILSWHQGRLFDMSGVTAPLFGGLYLEDTIAVLAVLALLVCHIAVRTVNDHDLLVSDAEAGGV